MKRTQLVGPALLISMLMACGGDSVTNPTPITGNPIPTTGRYVLYTLDGNTLPYSIPQSDGSTFTIVADTTDINTDHTYSHRTVVRVTSQGTTTTQPHTSTGTYALSGNTITFTDASDGSAQAGVVSNGVLTIIVDNTVVFVYHRQ